MGSSVLSVSGAVHRIEGDLYLEGVALERVAEAVGTPAYVYGAAVIRERYGQLATMLAPVPHRIH
jgi:diaminopimelate decarboxylase